MRRRQFVSLLGGAALAPLAPLLVYADLPVGCGVPVARDDGWPVAALSEDKLIDRGALCRMADRLAASIDANIHAVLVARRGTLVFERYFRGSDEIPGRIYGRRVENVTVDGPKRPLANSSANRVIVAGAASRYRDARAEVT